MKKKGLHDALMTNGIRKVIIKEKNSKGRVSKLRIQYRKKLANNREIFFVYYEIARLEIRPWEMRKGPTGKWEEFRRRFSLRVVSVTS